MFELKGKYGECKVFTNNCDNETISQLTNLLNQECIEGNQIRIMSDCHSGKGCVIGTTMTLSNKKVVPNLVGVDIGCGVTCIKLKEKRIDLPNFDSVVRKYMPSGFDIHDEAIATSNIEEMYCAKAVDLEKAYKSLGTLGGGNHYVELDKSGDNLYLVIHTGSRHLGIEVCNYYQELAYNKLKEKAAGGSFKELSYQLIDKLKSEGRNKEISKELAKFKEEYNNTHIPIPYELSYLEGEDFDAYIHDMKLVQEHASINRATIAKQLLKHAKLHEIERIDTIHNYVDVENMVLRKGSISAQKDELVIIPMNMRDGSLLCKGKGNLDWNCSAPHGAGRLMSRAKAKESISMTDYKHSMEGIYSTCVNRSTIDESPMAYKAMDEIMENIQDTVEIVEHITPIYNFKAGEMD
jgi:RNA-splicing ligase RtcB